MIIKQKKMISMAMVLLGRSARTVVIAICDNC
jgi:hypothetical protein